jgi:hypothetical protein
LLNVQGNETEIWLQIAFAIVGVLALVISTVYWDMKSRFPPKTTGQALFVSLPFCECPRRRNNLLEKPLMLEVSQLSGTHTLSSWFALAEL